MQQAGDDQILLGLGKRLQRGTRVTPLEQERQRAAVDLRDRVQAHGAIPVPDPQSVGFVGRFRVSPRDLDNEIVVGAGRRRNPGGLPAGLERLTDAHRPDPFDDGDHLRQVPEPIRSTFLGGRIEEVGRQAQRLLHKDDPARPGDVSEPTPILTCRQNG